MEKLYRYTSKGEGIFSAGKRLLPENLVEEVLEFKKWLIKPNLPNGNYRFYLTEKGKKIYEDTLLKCHRKYLENIKCYSINKAKVKNIVYEDDYQVVELR